MSSQPFHGSPLKTSSKSQNIHSQPLLKMTNGVLRRGNPTNGWRTTEITEENRRNKVLLVLDAADVGSGALSRDRQTAICLCAFSPHPGNGSPKGTSVPGHRCQQEEGARVSRLDGHVQTRSQCGGRSPTGSRKTGGGSAFSVGSGGCVSPGVTQKSYYVSWHIILRIKYKNGPFHTKGASYKEGNRFTNRIKRRNIPRRKFCFHHLLTSSKQSNQNH